MCAKGKFTHSLFPENQKLHTQAGISITSAKESKKKTVGGPPDHQHLSSCFIMSTLGYEQKVYNLCICDICDHLWYLFKRRTSCQSESSVEMQTEVVRSCAKRWSRAAWIHLFLKSSQAGCGCTLPGSGTPTSPIYWTRVLGLIGSYICTSVVKLEPDVHRQT